MNPVLLDTNAYAAFKRGDPEAIEILRRAPAIGISTVVLGELFAGFAGGAREDANREELGRFLASSRVTVLPVDSRTAERYATVYLTLRGAGTPIPTNDIWIAACAAQHGLDLFSFDRHFKMVEGLNVGTTIFELEQA